MANTARVTQSVLEVLTSSVGQARVTQSVIEYLIGLGVTCGSPPSGLVGQPYSHTFPSGGGEAPVTFSISFGALPPGLSLNASTGVASGTPSAPGTYTFTVRVHDYMGAVNSVSCSITVTRSPIIIQFFGWKLFRDVPCEDVVEGAEVQPVKRAV